MITRFANKRRIFIHFERKIMITSISINNNEILEKHKVNLDDNFSILVNKGPGSFHLSG